MLPDDTHFITDEASLRAPILSRCSGLPARCFAHSTSTATASLALPFCAVATQGPIWGRRLAPR